MATKKTIVKKLVGKKLASTTSAVATCPAINFKNDSFLREEVEKKISEKQKEIDSLYKQKRSFEDLLTKEAKQKIEKFKQSKEVKEYCIQRDLFYKEVMSHKFTISLSDVFHQSPQIKVLSDQYLNIRHYMFDFTSYLGRGAPLEPFENELKKFQGKANILKKTYIDLQVKYGVYDPLNRSCWSHDNFMNYGNP